MCLLFLCGPCSSPCRNCWSYLVHPSSSLEGEWNLDLLDRSWLEEGIYLHYVTVSKLHPLVLISSPLWSFFPGWGAPGIPLGTKMALTLLCWWHHCHLGGWGGWFRVTPLVAHKGELWVRRPLQCLLSGPYFLSEQRAFENTISILVFHFLPTVLVFPSLHLEMLVISLCRWQGLGDSFFRAHASKRRVMGTICQCSGLWDRRDTVKWSSQKSSLCSKIFVQGD